MSTPPRKAVNPRVSATIRQPRRGWFAATGLFLRDPHAGSIMKFLLLFGPVDLVDDIVPILGQLDDPYLLVYPIVLLFALRKINRYRYM